MNSDAQLAFMNEQSDDVPPACFLGQYVRLLK